MAELSDAHALAIERSCSLTAVALSGQRREGVRLVTGDKRHFGLSSALDFVYVPYPPVVSDWTRRTLTCGVGTSVFAVEGSNCRVSAAYSCRPGN